jgi:hypothetical protein
MDTQKELRRLRNVLRNGLRTLDVLEATLKPAPESAGKKTRRQSIKEHFETTTELGIWRKPEAARRSTKKPRTK